MWITRAKWKNKWMCMPPKLHAPGTQVLSILEAVLIVSPNNENFGTFMPTRPLRGEGRGWIG